MAVPKGRAVHVRGNRQRNAKVRDDGLPATFNNIFVAGQPYKGFKPILFSEEEIAQEAAQEAATSNKNIFMGIPKDKYYEKFCEVLDWQSGKSNAEDLGCIPKEVAKVINQEYKEVYDVLLDGCFEDCEDPAKKELLASHFAACGLDRATEVLEDDDLQAAILIGMEDDPNLIRKFRLSDWVRHSS